MLLDTMHVIRQSRHMDSISMAAVEHAGAVHTVMSQLMHASMWPLWLSCGQCCVVMAMYMDMLTWPCRLLGRTCELQLKQGIALHAQLDLLRTRGLEGDDSLLAV